MKLCRKDMQERMFFLVCKHLHVLRKVLHSGFCARFKLVKVAGNRFQLFPIVIV